MESRRGADAILDEDDMTPLIPFPPNRSPSMRPFPRWSRRSPSNRPRRRKSSTAATCRRALMRKHLDPESCPRRHLRDPSRARNLSTTELTGDRRRAVKAARWRTRTGRHHRWCADRPLERRKGHRANAKTLRGDLERMHLRGFRAREREGVRRAQSESGSMLPLWSMPKSSPREARGTSSGGSATTSSSSSETAVRSWKTTSPTSPKSSLSRPLPSRVCTRLRALPIGSSSDCKSIAPSAASTFRRRSYSKRTC